jgi:chromatin segregation and condensation protein Rec8/ScpA/Scc1 (kleisin family)
MENLLPLFIALTGAAVVLQALILLALYMAVRKSTARMEAIAEEVKSKAFPTIDTTQTLLSELRPKLNAITDDLMETTAAVRAQVQRVDATVNDAVDRGRLQIIRADELLTRTLDRVEHTSEVVHKTVVSPVRQVSGLVQGITAGVEFFLGNRSRRNGGGSREPRRPVPQDEMFI